MGSELSLLENQHGRLGFIRNFSSEVSSVPNSCPGDGKSSHPEDRPDSCSLDRGMHSTTQRVVPLAPGIVTSTCF